MICNANELTPAEKATFEKVLGRTIRDDESVSVCAFEQPQMAPQQKLEILNELKKYFAEVDQAGAPWNELEFEDALNEAMLSVRPGYRSHS